MDLENEIYNIKQIIKKINYLIDDLNTRFINAAGPSGYKSRTSYEIHDNIRSTKNLPIPDYEKTLKDLQELLEFNTFYLFILEGKKKVLGQGMQFKNLEYEIFILTRGRGYTLQEAAHELGIKYQYAKNISSKINKKLKGENNE